MRRATVRQLRKNVLVSHIKMDALGLYQRNLRLNSITIGMWYYGRQWGEGEKGRQKGRKEKEKEDFRK